MRGLQNIVAKCVAVMVLSMMLVVVANTGVIVTVPTTLFCEGTSSFDVCTMQDDSGYLMTPTEVVEAKGFSGGGILDASQASRLNGDIKGNDTTVTACGVSHLAVNRPGDDSHEQDAVQQKLCGQTDITGGRQRWVHREHENQRKLDTDHEDSVTPVDSTITDDVNVWFTQFIDIKGNVIGGNRIVAFFNDGTDIGNTVEDS